MKIALVYDWLNTKHGGGEDTFFAIADLYPTADIHCLIYNENKFGDQLKDRTIYTSRLQGFPAFFKQRPGLFLPFIRTAVNKLDFGDYDLVISVSSAWVKNITVPKETIHICYCYSPARMIWDSWPKYLSTQKLGPFHFGSVSRFITTKVVSKLRLWDYYNAKNVDHYIAISHHIAARIKKFYSLKAEVVYPPVVLENGISGQESHHGDYLLVLSTLSKYKNIDIVIDACKKASLKLIIAGDGPDISRLKKLADNNALITFLGRVDHDKKYRLLAKAKALVFPSIEDFGITPIEALGVGTPVIALRGGGLAETVIENVSGVFFDQSSSESLLHTIQSFNKKTFKSAEIISTAQKFSHKKFETAFKQKVEELYKGHKK